VHAIGDRAVRNVLDAFAAVDPAARAALALPLRIEHAQLVAPADVPRFAALGVAASMQPQHCVTDFPLAGRYWVDRLDFAYPWASLHGAGALLAFGSDAPVEPPDPSLGLHAALTRQTPGGEPPGGFVPQQRVGLDVALTAYTDGAARLAGDAARRGRLEPGAWADLVLWDRDLAGTPPADLHRARPRTTILEGTVVYEAAERDGPGTERYRGTNEG
jgi:predicted amidohydrolase YtcJ